MIYKRRASPSGEAPRNLLANKAVMRGFKVIWRIPVTCSATPSPLFLSLFILFCLHFFIFGYQTRGLALLDYHGDRHKRANDYEK